MVEPALGWILATLLTSQAAATGAPGLRTRAAAAAPEGPIPDYAVQDDGAWEGAPRWLSFGLEERLRFESRSGRLRDTAVPGPVEGWLSRSRFFLGIEPDTRPVALRLEAQDARTFAGDLPETPLSTNRLDLLQLALRFDLKPLVGAPVRVEVGRSSFDAVDRRLLARNRFRNTTNAFDGIRVFLGEETSARGLELIAAFPMEIRLDDADLPDEERRLLGLLGTLSFAKLTFEPYYLDFQASDASTRSLHTAGVHLFGVLGEAFDHDVSAAFQFGSVGGRDHRALALHAELGFSPEVPASPRGALFLNYASGDRDPDDGRSGRFDPLLGASHTMYGFTDLFVWQNLVNPTLSLSLRPLPRIGVELYYRLYWLASSRDAFVRAGLVDPTGESGSFLGQGLDLAIRYRLFSFAQVELQYGELFAGSFIDRTGGGRGTRTLFASIILETGGG